jgi:hypothetical protein
MNENENTSVIRHHGLESSNLVAATMTAAARVRRATINESVFYVKTHVDTP